MDSNRVQKYSSSGSDEDNNNNNNNNNNNKNKNNQRHQDQVVDIRKRKRMISNRESARRSRRRKQQHLDNLMAQINQLKIHNDQIFASTTTTTQLYLNFEAQNSVLRAQVDELTNRLDSLNDIVRCLTDTATASASTTSESDEREGFGGFDVEIDDMLNPWGFSFPNCSVMPAMDAFMC